VKAIKHQIEHVYQPTNTTCGYAALSMLLSHYNQHISVEELLKAVPHPKNEKGESTGSVTAQLVTWAQQQGYKAHMYSFDCLVLDLAWKHLSPKQTIARLKAARGKRDAQVFNSHWANIYIDAYISMLEAGAKLTIMPLVTSSLVNKLLTKGPVYANICSTVRDGNGRTRAVGVRKTVLDDIRGKVSNHSVIIYGNDTKGNYLVDDPWDGLLTVDPETMICSITAAQIECDNQIFVIER
jgi:hypothetical protein